VSGETQEIDQLLNDQDGDSDLVKKLRRVIRDQKQSVREATEAAETVRRESTFKELGLDPNAGMTKLFYETYKGDLTSEAVREAAQGYGLLQPEGEQVPAGEGQEPQGNPQSQEQQVFNTMNSAVAGSQPGDGEVDPVQRSQQVFKETYNKTGNSDEAMARVFADKLGTAVGQKK